MKKVHKKSKIFKIEKMKNKIRKISNENENDKNNLNLHESCLCNMDINELLDGEFILNQDLFLLEDCNSHRHETCPCEEIKIKSSNFLKLNSCTNKEHLDFCKSKTVENVEHDEHEEHDSFCKLDFLNCNASSWTDSFSDEIFKPFN
jgi:hypothetical protein